MIEKTNEFRRFGGPIQLASNALSTIKAIDPVFFDKIMEYFTFTGIRTNGIKDGVRTEWCVCITHVLDRCVELMKGWVTDIFCSCSHPYPSTAHKWVSNVNLRMKHDFIEKNVACVR